MTMLNTPEIEARELDRRASDGISVRLLWNADANRVSVTVDDERLGDSFELEVEPAEAVWAFHHPYAYTQALTHSPAGRLGHRGAAEASQRGSE
jgi:hypothetical protein